MNVKYSKLCSFDGKSMVARTVNQILDIPFEILHYTISKPWKNKTEFVCVKVSRKDVVGAVLGTGGSAELFPESILYLLAWPLSRARYPHSILLLEMPLRHATLALVGAFYLGSCSARCRAVPVSYADTAQPRGRSRIVTYTRHGNPIRFH